MDLNNLVKSIKNFEGVTRKKSISKLLSILGNSDKISGHTYLSYGDDAAAIKLGNGKLLLLAADGIWDKLMKADPYWAGYCSVLVNVNDIAAMGGEPLAMVNVLSIKDENTCFKVMEGVREGAKKFGVPMVGGHLHPATPYNVLDVSIVGIVSEDSVITSHNAKIGDKIIIAIDLDGNIHPNFPLAWDTTTHKNSKLVRAQIKAMKKIASKKLVNAGKDISNPGTIGTLGMMLEASNTGAIVELDKIPRNESVEWERWLKLYPGSGFVFSCPEECVEECIEILSKVNLTANVVGEIIPDRKLYLKYKNTKKIVFDFRKEYIVGLRS